MTRILAALLFFLLLEGTAFAEATWTIEPTPSWVDPIEAPLDATLPDDAKALARLLYDQQIRVGQSVDSYFKWSRRILDEAGLTASSQISIDFDPSFQRLVLHSVTVRRGSEHFERLAPDAVRLVQREPNLEMQIFDGRQSAVLFVRDLRVGDVVECAFTIRGNDPTLHGHYSDSIALGSLEPVARIHARLVLENGRRAHLLIHAPDGNRAPFATDPVVRGATTEYRWSLTDVKGYKADPSTPAWYSPLPWIQLSDFESWREVATWGRELFRTAAPVKRTLSDWARKSLDEAGSSDAYALRAIRFVQDEVRYVGIETGLGRRQPTDPSTVFERRYGDCKDKAVLLATLLGLGGIRAGPVLVSTTRGHVIQEWIPTPDAFDHVIVRADPANSAPLWIDATAMLQGGGLDRFRRSNYEHVLPLDEGTTALEPLPLLPLARPLIAVRDHFFVPFPSDKEETLLDAERTYQDETADSMRTQLRGKTAEEITKFVVALYQTDFPAIHETRAAELVDDREGNVMRLVAHLSIPKLWALDELKAAHVASFTARMLDGMLDRPPTKSRTAPLAMPFPFRATMQIDISLPFEMTVVPSETTVEDEAFRLNLITSYNAQNLHYAYELATRSPIVAAEATATHLERVDEAHALLSRGVTYRAPLVDGFNWSVFIAFVGCIPFMAWGTIRAYRFEPRTIRAKTSVMPGDPRLVGLGGWLILLGFALVTTPIFVLASFVQDCRSVLSLASWHEMTIPGSAGYSPALAVMVVVEALINAMAVFYGLAIAILFFKKRRAFPFHFTVYAVGLAVFSIVDLVLALAIVPKIDHGAAFRVAARATIWATIWVTYVHRARRVAWTFVEAPPKRRRRRKVSRA